MKYVPARCSGDGSIDRSVIYDRGRGAVIERIAHGSDVLRGAGRGGGIKTKGRGNRGVGCRFAHTHSIARRWRTLNVQGHIGIAGRTLVTPGFYVQRLRAARRSDGTIHVVCVYKGGVAGIKRISHHRDGLL